MQSLICPIYAAALCFSWQSLQPGGGGAVRRACNKGNKCDHGHTTPLCTCDQQQQLVIRADPQQQRDGALSASHSSRMLCAAAPGPPLHCCLHHNWNGGKAAAVLRAESEICHYLPSTSSPGSCKPLKVSRVPKWLQHH